MNTKQMNTPNMPNVYFQYIHENTITTLPSRVPGLHVIGMEIRGTWLLSATIRFVFVVGMIAQSW